MYSNFYFYSLKRTNTGSSSALSSRRYATFQQIVNVLVLCGLEPEIRLERKNVGAGLT